MKELKCKRSRSFPWLAILSLGLILVTSALSVSAQLAPSDTDATQARLSRARALTATHNLTAAAFELDAILTSTNDEVLRDVARIMLMGIHLEQADYGRAQALLDVTYKARSQQNEVSARSYFAVAGRTANGLREHLDRFRAVGLHIGNKDLPSEAVADLDRVRSLLEHVIEQAKSIGSEGDKNTDAFALLEDVASLRMSLSRDMEDRTRWQDEIADARLHLSASDTRLASLNGGVADVSQSPLLTAVKGTLTQPVVSRESKPSESTNTSNQDNSNATKGSAVTTEPAPVDIFYVGSLVDHATQKVSPSYPTFAKSANVTGIVRVDLVIDEKGYVLTAQSTTGPPMLRQAAIDASTRWKFRPMIQNGQPVRAAGFINFNFTAR